MTKYSIFIKMQNISKLIPLLIILFLFTDYRLAMAQKSTDNSFGIFTSSNDIGSVSIPGYVEYNEDEGIYRISGTGDNMWFDKDSFHYLWMKVSGDLSLEANILWIGEGINPHRKAGLIIRQNLKSGSQYADVMVHGDGLTSLQFREYEDSLTHEFQSHINNPSRVKIQKEGKYITMFAGNEGEIFEPAGGALRLNFGDPFYVGLAICSHDNSVLETAEFSNVNFFQLSENNSKKELVSVLETLNIESKNRKTIFITNEHIEAPNWSLDNSFLIYNSSGLLYKFPFQRGFPKRINTDFAINCNNDHGLSPDNNTMAISDQTSDDKKSRIYIVPIEGGIPKLVTQRGPSYWHGWSPDGTALAYCAERNGEYDIYTIPVGGGEEKQLTFSTGLDDGPDYSPDGEYIYYNSVRTGIMQIWRMRNDGSEQTQITFDDYNDWFPHPSPDGKWLVFLSYNKNVEGHPPNKDVFLRIISLENGKVEILTKLFGGQGTINVPSWSPDSKNIAFVSYFFNRKPNH